MEEKNGPKVQASETMSQIDPTISHAQPVHPSAAWPEEPRSLAITQLERIALGVWDAALILMPIALLVKAILVALFGGTLNGMTVESEDHESTEIVFLLRFNGQMVTIFTIIFITIMSTLVKRYALWRAERGATLAELEHLQGSVSMVSTLKMTWLLRSFRVQSLSLLFVWCFYYVGSQAAKEEFKRVDSDPFKSMSNVLIQRSDGVSIFDNNAPSTLNDSDFTTNTNFKTLLSETNVAFGSIFLSALSKKASALDSGSWSVYQSPSVYATLIDDSVVSKTAGWQKRPAGLWSRPVSYQDLPLFQYDPVYKVANVTAILGTYSATNVSYLWVRCDIGEQYPVSSFPNVTYHNATTDISLLPLDPSGPTDVHGNKQRQLALWYRGFNGTNLEAHRQVCNLSTSSYDMDVVCTSRSCLPSRIQFVNGLDGSHATSYNTPFADQQFLRSFWSNMSTALGVQDDYLQPSLANRFFNPWQQYSKTGFQFDATSLFNTYYRLSQITLSIRHIPQASSGSWTGDKFFNRAAVHGAVSNPQVKVSWPWLAMDVVCALILLTAASACAWFRVRTIAPDVLGYVSSLTRNNPDLTLPTEGSTLNGLQRARMLKDVKVKIGAITGPDGVARIGFTTVDAEGSQLQKGAKYV